MQNLSKYAIFTVAVKMLFLERLGRGNVLPSEQQLSQQLIARLQSSIPSSWTLEVGSGEQSTGSVGGPDRQYDLLLYLSDPLGVTARIVVEIKHSLHPQAALLLIRQAREYMAHADALLVLSPFISLRTQELLTSAGINYFDATGNFRLRLDHPAIYIERLGASENPWPEKWPLRSLKSPTAARVVRALCDFQPPYAVQEVATRAGVGLGTLTKALELLDREALITRAPRGKKYQGEIREVNWPQLIRRWTQDYIFESSNSTVPYLDPRGLDAFFTRLKKANQPYAVTGSFASVHFAPIVQPRLAAVYVEDIDQASEALSLRRAERGANILLVRPLDPVVFARTLKRDGLTYVALSQVAADLLTTSGRGPQEGAALIDWMKENEDAWRQ